jgi:hypothetical protein
MLGGGRICGVSVYICHKKIMSISIDNNLIYIKPIPFFFWWLFILKFQSVNPSFVSILRKVWNLKQIEDFYNKVHASI